MTTERKTIVIVDDDPIMRDLYDAILGELFEIQFAVDGEEGLDLVRKVVPHLAILDVNMPKMHGFELCRKLRAEDSLKAMKILFISAKSYQSDINTAREIGGNDYMVKPFGTKDMLAKVQSLLT